MCRVELSLCFSVFHLSYFCLLFCLLVLPYYVVNLVLNGCVGESALDSDRNEPLNDRQTLEQQGALAMVIRHLRNAPSKVAEEFETSITDLSQNFNGNWYESV